MNRTRLAFARMFRVLKTVLPLLVGLVALLLVVGWLAGVFEEKIEPGQQPVSGRRFAGGPTGVVAEVVKQYEEESLGTLKAADRTTISSRIMARIDEILVNADDAVEKGQVLVRLQKDDLRARLSQAQESLTSAKVTREEAQRSFDRIENLFQRGAAAEAEFDAAKAARDVAEAEVRKAQQAVREATTNLAFAAISAPRSGRIVDRLAEPGDLAVPGQPLLALYDPKSLRLEVPVRESLAVALQPGEEVSVHIDALDRDFTGTVSQRVPQAEAASRSFLVKVDLPQDEGLFEGMFGRLRIPVGKRRHLCLPASAVRQIGQLQLVDVVRADGTLERRLIRTGRRGFPGKVEVLSGVEAGEQVVLDPDGDSPEDALSPEPVHREQP